MSHTPGAHPYNWDPNPGDIFTSTATAARDQEYQLQDLKQDGSQDRIVITQTKTTDVSSYPGVPRKASTETPSNGPISRTNVTNKTCLSNASWF